MRIDVVTSGVEGGTYVAVTLDGQRTGKSWVSRTRLLPWVVVMV